MGYLAIRLFHLSKRLHTSSLFPLSLFFIRSLPTSVTLHSCKAACRQIPRHKLPFHEPIKSRWHLSCVASVYTAHSEQQLRKPPFVSIRVAYQLLAKQQLSVYSSSALLLRAINGKRAGKKRTTRSCLSLTWKECALPQTQQMPLLSSVSQYQTTARNLTRTASHNGLQSLLIVKSLTCWI